jgi:hypothetical protein
VPFYDDWCRFDRTDTRTTRLWALREKAGGRAKVVERLIAAFRSHYDDLRRIAGDIRRLGFASAGRILGERLPRGKRARSGEAGEILATELVEEQLNYKIPVRRIRYKDGREMALRGDDFVGIAEEQGQLRFLKGECKSRRHLSNSTIKQARRSLKRDDGRPTATSLLFVADRLMEGDDAAANLGRRIRDEVARRAMPASRIEHMVFTLSGNDPTSHLASDLRSAGTAHRQTSVNLHIDDHQDFIAEVYEKAGDLGNR